MSVILSAVLEPRLQNLRRRLSLHAPLITIFLVTLSKGHGRRWTLRPNAPAKDVFFPSHALRNSEWVRETTRQFNWMQHGHKVLCIQMLLRMTWTVAIRDVLPFFGQLRNSNHWQSMGKE